MAKSSTEAPFKPGDIVRLKSGGPDMTVDHIDKNIGSNVVDSLYASWFAGAKRHHERFRFNSIEPVPEEERQKKKK